MGPGAAARYLQKGLGLAEGNKPLVACITRLVPQKAGAQHPAVLLQGLSEGMLDEPRQILLPESCLAKACLQLGRHVLARAG